jgi:hypothetical protein
MDSSWASWRSSSSRLGGNGVRARDMCQTGLEGEGGEKERGVAFDLPDVLLFVPKPPPNAGVLCCWLLVWPKPPKPPPKDIASVYRPGVEMGEVVVVVGIADAGNARRG